MASQSRLLIVDDIEDNRAILARRLLRHGFEIVEADGGRAALSIIAEQDIDLVLLDVMMPEIDGFEVLRQVRQSHSRLSLPVIMVTAKSESDDVVQAFELGANDFVSKPVNFAVALSRIQAQLAQKRIEEAMAGVNRQLEHQIAERTRELRETNEHLQVQIEESNRAAARIQHLVYHDTLTGLANRAGFMEHLNRSLARVQRQSEFLAILCLDLDHFKSVNDTLGHPVGDSLLEQVATRLKKCSRDTDLAARLGGDEFAVVQAALRSAEDAAALAARIIKRLGEPFEIDGHQVVVGASIGIATAPADGVMSDLLLKNADLALYRAKRDGRNAYRFFQPEMDQRAQERRRLELDIRKAIATDEFELHFQPILDLQSGRVSTFEALIRWNHPTRGTIMPLEFIPLAEETGLIVPIGEWVVAKACEEAANWDASIGIAVNVSAAQFKGARLFEAIKDALDRSGVAPERLEVEITESVLADTNGEALPTLLRLRELGVRISMDDFGTGYSSLSYLRSFPFDKIKIDRSFVRDLATHEECAAIVRAVTGLGSSLGMATTAEGVETEIQLETLRAQGCTEIQGYLLSPPRPAADLPGLLASLGGRPVMALRANADYRLPVPCAG